MTSRVISLRFGHHPFVAQNSIPRDTLDLWRMFCPGWDHQCLGMLCDRKLARLALLFQAVKQVLSSPVVVNVRKTEGNPKPFYVTHLSENVSYNQLKLVQTYDTLATQAKFVQTNETQVYSYKRGQKSTRLNKIHRVGLSSPPGSTARSSVVLDSLNQV